MLIVLANEREAEICWLGRLKWLPLFQQVKENCLNKTKFESLCDNASLLKNEAEAMSEGEADLFIMFFIRNV